MKKNSFYNVQHSPIGAFASFTLGFKGAKGGLGLELGKPADENVYIGLQSRDGKRYEALPFFTSLNDESSRYDVEKQTEPESQSDEKDKAVEESLQRVESAEIFPSHPTSANSQTPSGWYHPSTTELVYYNDEMIERTLEAATDTWTAGDLTFKIYSSVRPVPDPAQATEEEVKAAIVPAVFAELTIDNTAGEIARRAFFGYEGSDPYSSMRITHEDDEHYTGVGQGRQTALICADQDVTPALGFGIEKVLEEELEHNLKFGLGIVGALLMEVPAGQKRTFRVAVCFYKGGLVTTGIDTSYYYTRYFKRIEDVGTYALEQWDELTDTCEQANRWIGEGTLNEDQHFMLAHSIHSYYGSTQLLQTLDDQPLWIVNEGEYRMMNTLDLTADQLYYELIMNPWTVRNELELFVDRYSYYDQVSFPGDRTEYPGGLSFTHDVGVANVFSRPQYSAYEMAGIEDCFSYMSHEELVNWLCCALTYIEQTGDLEFKDKYLKLLEDGLESMLNRDHPEPSQRNGLMGLDSHRTQGGAEITTYDSLDVSLGQSRNNIYLAGKCWAVYIALEKLFYSEDRTVRAEEAGAQADRCAATITAQLNEQGYIPAVIGEGNDSRIIPAIEGLVFPYFTGCAEALEREGRFADYLNALHTHLRTVLVKGTCLFDNGAWKLSSTSNNSWLSKIYLSQFIAREIMGLVWDEQGQAADAAHVEWLTHPEYSYWCWSDQILSGIISGSKYYPRGVTSILWLWEKGNSALRTPEIFSQKKTLIHK